MKGCLRITKYIYDYYQFINARRNKNFGIKAVEYIIFHLVENNVFDVFFTEIFVRNFRKYFRNKNFCEKTIKYFIFNLDGK